MAETWHIAPHCEHDACSRLFVSFGGLDGIRSVIPRATMRMLINQRAKAALLDDALTALDAFPKELHDYAAFNWWNETAWPLRERIAGQKGR